MSSHSFSCSKCCLNKDASLSISISLATGTYVQATELQFPKSARFYPLIIVGIFWVKNSNSLDQEENIASITFDSIKEFVFKIIEKVEKVEILLLKIYLHQHMWS